MPVAGEILFRSRDDILNDMIAEMLSRVPDAYLGIDGNIRLFYETFGGVFEAAFLALQIESEDMFVQTANPVALDRHGIQYGLPRKIGTPSVGSLRFTGAGGVFIPSSSEVAYDPGTGDDLLYFATTASGTIPNPGHPSAPTPTDFSAGLLPAGTYEYVVTFVTAGGETAPGDESIGRTVAINRLIRLSGIPVGGPGTTQRKVYRQVDGTGYQLLTTIADNTTVTYDDNIPSNAGFGALPTFSTAEQITLAGESEDNGVKYNVLTSSITLLTDVPEGVTDVINPVDFTGASDPETTESFRGHLLNRIRAPGTGSPEDLKSWAEEINGVETATVFENDNVGTPTNGHTTVRIAGPNGSTPGAGVIADVLANLKSRNMANITIHVATFTAVPTAVSVTTTLQTGFLLADVTDGVAQAIRDYINALGVGETLRIAGIVDAIYGLPGIADVTVTTPASNQATGATSKRTPGTITVS